MKYRCLYASVTAALNEKDNQVITNCQWHERDGWKKRGFNRSMNLQKQNVKEKDL